MISLFPFWLSLEKFVIFASTQFLAIYKPLQNGGILMLVKIKSIPNPNGSI